MARETETRSTIGRVEVRAAAAGSAPVIGGYAAKFGLWSQDLGGFRERVAPSAFRKTIADGADVLARVEHQVLIGRTSSGTLRLLPDDVGLGYEVDVPDTTVGRDLLVMVGRGDITGSSFAFRTILDEWDLEGEVPLRTLVETALVDVAPTHDPAYLDSTAAQVRSLSALTSLSRATGRPVDVLTAAAGAGELRAALVADAPTVIDLGAVTRDTPGERSSGPAPATLSVAAARLRLRLQAQE